MVSLLFANNATTNLAGPITATATSLNVAAGTGVLFPVPGSGAYFKLTLQDAATETLTEIMHVTAKSGDTFTILRAQEGTTALNWLAGDLAGNLLTAGSLAGFAQTSNLPSQFYTGSDVTAATNAVVVSNFTPANTAPVAGQNFLVVKGSASNTGAVTLQIGSSGAQISVTYKDGSALAANDWPANAEALLYYTGGVYQFVACMAAPVPISTIINQIITTGTFQQIVANPILYVGGTGANDSNNGTSSATPKATITGALLAAAAFNFATTSLTIMVAAGNYVQPANYALTGGPIVVTGASAGSTILSGVAGVAANVRFANCTLTNTSSSAAAILVQNGGAVEVDNCIVLLNGGSNQGLQTGPGGSIVINGGVTFTGSGQFALYCNGGAIFLGKTTIAVSGSPTYSAFAFAANGGVILSVGATFSGSANGQRYSASTNAVIDTNGGGPNYFPGSTAGATATGGVYV